VIRAPVVLALTLSFWPSLAAPSVPLKVNREYFETAAKTGGDYYFWAPGEFASSSLHIPIQHEEVLLAYGTAVCH